MLEAEVQVTAGTRGGGGVESEERGRTCGRLRVSERRHTRAVPSGACFRACFVNRRRPGRALPAGEAAGLSRGPRRPREPVRLRAPTRSPWRRPPRLPEQRPQAPLCPRRLLCPTAAWVHRRGRATCPAQGTAAASARPQRPRPGTRGPAGNGSPSCRPLGLAVRRGDSQVNSRHRWRRPPRRRRTC